MQLMNLYTGQTIQVKPVSTQGFYVCSAFRYERWPAQTSLVKVLIAGTPVKVSGHWWYHLIAVFDTFILVLNKERYEQWRILSNTGLAPERYVDALYHRGRYYAVTADSGNVLVWEPNVYGEFIQ